MDYMLRLRWLAVVGVLCALFIGSSASLALGLDYGSLMHETWSDGSKVNGAYGTKADIYSYGRTSTGVKVNSIYLRDAIYPDAALVEVGYTATASHDPWLFSARYIRGQYGDHDWVDHLFPYNYRTTVKLQNTSGNDNWAVYYAAENVITWWDVVANDTKHLEYGSPYVGEERSTTAIAGNASFTANQYLYKSGGNWVWGNWNYGELNYADGSWYWHADELRNWNHHAYSSQ